MIKSNYSYFVTDASISIKYSLSRGCTNTRIRNQRCYGMWDH